LRQLCGERGRLGLEGAEFGLRQRRCAGRLTVSGSWWTSLMRNS
jgi:hypothetical protein